VTSIHAAQYDSIGFHHSN